MAQSRSFVTVGCSSWTRLQGRPSPEAMMHLPSVSDFPPYFQKNCQPLWKIFPITPFPQKIFQFSSTKIKFLMTFFSHWLNFEFPLFSLFQNISLPISGKLLFPPTFANVPPDFVKFTSFYILYLFFVSPLVWPWCIYASHKACTGRPCPTASVPYCQPSLRANLLITIICQGYEDEVVNNSKMKLSTVQRRSCQQFKDEVVNNSKMKLSTIQRWSCQQFKDEVVNNSKMVIKRTIYSTNKLINKHVINSFHVF